MRKSGLKVSQTYHVLKNEMLRSPTPGFTLRYVYNNLAKEDRWILERGDAKHLVDIFEDRAKK